MLSDPKTHLDNINAVFQGLAIFWITGLIVLIPLAIWLFRRYGGYWMRAYESPEQILKRRYARGEIDREDYEQRLRDLKG